MGLSTRALEPDSLDPDPQCGYNVVSSKRHEDCANCTTDWISVRRSIARSSDPDRGRVAWCKGKGLWIRIPDLHRIQIQGPVWRASLPTSMDLKLYSTDLAHWHITEENLLHKVKTQYVHS